MRQQKQISVQRSCRVTRLALSLLIFLPFSLSFHHIHRCRNEITTYTVCTLRKRFSNATFLFENTFLHQSRFSTHKAHTQLAYTYLHECRVKHECIRLRESPLVTVCEPHVHAVLAGEGVCAEECVWEGQRLTGQQQAGNWRRGETHLRSALTVENLKPKREWD